MEKEAIERQFEQQRVSKVLVEIEKQEEALLDKSGTLKESVVQLRKGFWDDVTVNLDEPDEIIETYASIKQQAELLSERERSHGQLANELNKLNQLKDSPYFGRIDFIEDGEEEEQIYIGRSSLMDAHEEQFLIYDWRAPISSLYYDYALGPAEYDTPAGTITGKMSLKRQFIIRQGNLAGMFDTGITIGDHLLQQALGNQASTKMKSIVATIQREQNKIIRNETSNYLVVQGVAGSGKTSAALQRVAYLMYRYRDLLNENNMVLFSPNSLFNSYVANVLPELGEENIQQTTFLEHVKNNVEGLLTVESPFEQMEYTLTGQEEEQYELRMKSVQFKSSLAYKQLLDEFITSLNEAGISFGEIVFRGQVVVTKEALKQYFYSLDARISLPNKLDQAARWLMKQLTNLKQQEMNKDWVMEKIELLDDEAYTKVYHELQKREDMDEFYDSGKEEEYLREKVVSEAFEPLFEKVKQYVFVRLVATYEQFFTSWQPKQKPDQWKALCTFSQEQLDEGLLLWEEAAPFVYFKGKVLGERADRSIRHLIIDEAQDYTPFQMAYIQHLFPHTQMTLLGDVNQAIYAQTREGNPLQKTNDKKVERIELTKSYRSTKQIVEFTREFAPTSGVIQPFERDGEQPSLIQVKDLDHADQMAKKINERLEKGHETIGIVCKTSEESEHVESMLSSKLAVNRVDETTQTFEKGVLILPIYLAKGIEFDAVVIPEGSSSHYGEQDRTLFYTACTRAMHDLAVFSTSDWCTFIDEVEPQYYELVSV